jgi:small subunit ribosomal protein S6
MQNFYETLLIVTPEADDDGVSAVIGDLRTTIESDGGTVLQARVWERRKLAYMVKGKTEGIYVIIHADGERTLPAVLKERMKLDESVIRSMVVRLSGQQEIDVRQEIAERDHAGDEAAIEEQRVAAERRHEAEAASAAMSLDEIVAAEEAEAETADSDAGDVGDDGEAESSDSDAGDVGDDGEAESADSDAGDLGDGGEATGGDNEGPTVETSLADENADDVAGDSEDSTVDDEGKEG